MSRSRASNSRQNGYSNSASNGDESSAAAYARQTLCALIKEQVYKEEIDTTIVTVRMTVYSLYLTPINLEN